MDRETGITQNLGLARACANRFRGRGIEYDDLYQAACVGLVQAVDRFDESRGLRFSTYAVPVILGEVRRLFREGGAVKVSRGLRDLSRKAAAESKAYAQKYGRMPTVTELAQRLGVDAETAAQALGAAQAPISLTAEDDSGNAMDIPDDAKEEELTDVLSLRQAIGKLEAQDRKLLYFRYFQSETQTQTAAKLGMTQVQVSRREKKLMTTLRQALG
ncbi:MULTISPECIES: sigma-70 family RNA polymerase sigma factor [Caproicibacterium]|jgi:RNA polymerase sporulation-specific sigma factor|uniref:Sigma-70 family RNA polymerase sigma factor n=2 Tax=Bacteria TaxID=2 RepID=A0A859DRL6_9FIRM|nr:sigma-70 family RNA polymerase sigma factor [Caproicibacterium lactatifermentans]ARP49975.1 flagellar biosynthesis protein FliA [Ruminococcaceae bacterium CPB6]QKN24304.1 sigma-70 family RNA polymerase sigma factor [Caproicibacterium lactatifermentans]QKO30682.1 sigma-70 family RNA polymerase sigma factor [Caproicibacterium lactatifermentans]